jgi:alpha-glucosidase
MKRTPWESKSSSISFPTTHQNQHEWFKAALNSAPGSPERARYIFRDGKGDSGELPPNDWESVFGGQAWQRITEADGRLGQWYLHLFATEQPDFNWENEEVRQHFEQVLRFWLDRGVDGFRIDVAHGMVKEAGLPDVKSKSKMLDKDARPYWNQPGVHEIYRAWRKIFDSYPGDRMGVAEAWVPSEDLPLYLRPDELANSFNFQFLDSKWDPKIIKKNIKETFKNLAGSGAPASWVYENHDVTRKVTRFDRGLGGGGVSTPKERYGNLKKFSLERGVRRARAGALLMLALPGGAYIYQGEELGLPEVTDIPKDRLEDPRWHMSGFTDPGRDGCRVPIPWTSSKDGAHGFSTRQSLTPVEAWLPQPKGWGDFAVDKQEQSQHSTLWLYRKALKIRQNEEGLGDGEMEWIKQGEKVVAFSRPGGFQCWVNFGKTIKIPKGSKVLLSSIPLEGRKLPKDAAVWFKA